MGVDVRGTQNGLALRGELDFAEAENLETCCGERGRFARGLSSWSDGPPESRRGSLP